MANACQGEDYSIGVQVQMLEGGANDGGGASKGREEAAGTAIMTSCLYPCSVLTWWLPHGSAVCGQSLSA